MIVMYRYVIMNNTDMVVRLSENFRPFPIPIYLHFCLIISNIQEYMFETPIMTFFNFYPSNTFILSQLDKIPLQEPRTRSFAIFNCNILFLRELNCSQG